jgi:predicted amidohydrolase
MKVAAIAWKIRKIRRDSEFFAHLYDLVERAHEAEAELLVLPELFCLELLQLAPNLKEPDVPKYLVQFSQAIEDWLTRISASSDLAIVGGSHFRQGELGIVNACAIADPQTGLTFGVKNNLTSYERDVWKLEPGSGLAISPHPRIGVTICYDSEFPESGRALAEAGVFVQCVPAFTETRHGFQRVRYCCQARAVENQNFVIHSSLVGDLGQEPVPTTYGSSAIIAPSISPFPENPILAETNLNEEGIALANVHFNTMIDARETGDVRNWHDRHAGRWQVN